MGLSRAIISWSGEAPLPFGNHSHEWDSARASLLQIWQKLVMIRLPITHKCSAQGYLLVLRDPVVRRAGPSLLPVGPRVQRFRMNCKRKSEHWRYRHRQGET